MLGICSILLLSCGGEEATSLSPAPTSDSEEIQSEAPLPTGTGKAAEAGKAPTRHAHERPLPSFEGRTLDGQMLSISSLIGKRLVLFFFNPEAKDVDPVAEAVAAIAAERKRYNFGVIGIAVGSSPEQARQFVAKMGFDFPVIDDSRGLITRKLNLRSPTTLLSIDSEGYLGDLAMTYFNTDIPDAPTVIANSIREKLRLPKDSEIPSGEFNQNPRAPLFEAERLDGGEPLRLADMAGRPVVLIFFLHTCPHCHAALQFFKEQLANIPEDKRPELLGISLARGASRATVHGSLRAEDIDYFPVLMDSSGSIANEYGAFGGVPVIYLIDGEGRIVQRTQGWQLGREQALLRMQLARIAGVQVPMLLNPKGYSGNDVCGVCHSPAHDSWLFTKHASAYDTLVTHGEERNPECVGCHVVGYNEPGGFTIEEHPEYLENVGCEDCHGRGGPHLSPEFVEEGNYEPACVGCHNPTHSLGFDYATFLPKISHAAVAALTPKEREKMIAGHSKPRDVLPKGADYVGSEACQSCHTAEYATWSAGDHAHAGKTLEAKKKADDINCLACHTTGYDRPGGFPAAGKLAAHPNLNNVGCESCHGPGGDHVAEGARKIGTIVSLGDKCDSCVILQICGSCHDEANDPGFEFEVEEKIERQRHGTIEPGTGKPLSKSPASGADALQSGWAHLFAELASRDGSSPAILPAPIHGIQ
jgi:peroxiredoxin